MSFSYFFRESGSGILTAPLPKKPSVLPSRSTAAPAPFYLKRPRDEERIAAGPALFEWTGYRSSAGDGRTFTLEIAKDEQFRELAVTQDKLRDCRAVVREQLQPNQSYFWRVTATNPHGATANALGPRRFTVDPDLPNTVDAALVEQEVG